MNDFNDVMRELENGKQDTKAGLKHGKSLDLYIKKMVHTFLYSAKTLKVQVLENIRLLKIQCILI